MPLALVAIQPPKVDSSIESGSIPIVTPCCFKDLLKGKSENWPSRQAPEPEHQNAFDSLQIPAMNVTSYWCCCESKTVYKSDEFWWYITLIARHTLYTVYIIIIYIYVYIHIVLGCYVISMKVPASWDPCQWCQLQSWQLHLLHWPIEPCWGHACQGTPSVGNPLPGRQPTTFHATLLPIILLSLSDSCPSNYFGDINLSGAIRSHQVLGWALCGRGHIGPSTNGDYAKSQAVIIWHGCAQQGLQGQERSLTVKGDATGRLVDLLTSCCLWFDSEMHRLLPKTSQNIPKPFTNSRNEFQNTASTAVQKNAVLDIYLGNVHQCALSETQSSVPFHFPFHIGCLDFFFGLRTYDGVWKALHLPRAQSPNICQAMSSPST